MKPPAQRIRKPKGGMTPLSGFAPVKTGPEREIVSAIAWPCVATRSPFAIYNTPAATDDAYLKAAGRRPRIHKRKVHVEDLDLTVYIVVADRE